MKWGNFLISKVLKFDESIELFADFLPNDNDYKSTKKLCWLDSKAPLLIFIN